MQGELSLDGQALGLQALDVKLEQEAAGRSALDLALRSSLLGQIAANAEMTQGGALRGEIKADLPRLGALRPWLPPAWRIEGSAQLQAQLSGNRQQPQLHGRLAAQVASLSHASSGAGGQQGLLRAEFDGQGLQLQEFRLKAWANKAANSQAAAACAGAMPNRARSSSCKLNASACSTASSAAWC